jgi:hypothetical protein
MRQVAQMPLRRLAALLPVLLLPLMLAACGSDTGVTPSGTPISCGTPPSTTSTAVSTGVVTPVGTSSTSGAGQGNTTPATVPTLPLAPGVTVASGRLTITPDASHYSPCVIIHATIANGFESTIYVTDHHTSCGLLTLERQVNDSWQSEGHCPLGTPTRLLEIPTNTAVAQSITPGETGIRPTSWPSGTYRLALAYATGSSDHLIQQAPIYSATFTIG